mgnify:CR=1 FL=1
MGENPEAGKSSNIILDSGPVACLGDEIRETMARIGSGRGTCLDISRAVSLMRRRTDMLYNHGLSVAQAKARREYPPPDDE